MAQETDFALVAYREDGRWEVSLLPPRSADDLDSLLRALRQQPSEGGTLGLVSVADDFFLLARLTAGETRLLLSDLTAATEWPLAAQVLQTLDVTVPEEEEPDHPVPAGDLEIVADLGMDGLAMAALCADEELFPDEMLGRIAERLGFADQFDAAVDAAS
ncbi:MAG: tRNA adenosine deaminase-associated protein [Actinomycetes bacterium]